MTWPIAGGKGEGVEALRFAGPSPPEEGLQQCIVAIYDQPDSQLARATSGMGEDSRASFGLNEFVGKHGLEGAKGLVWFQVLG